jgi:hypothetical protein
MESRPSPIRYGQNQRNYGELYALFGEKNRKYTAFSFWQRAREKSSPVTA